MSLLPRPDETCPNCGSLYDRGQKRKLIDSECGHGKCFECMFKTTGCQLCLRENSGSAGGHQRMFASVHGRVRAPPVRSRIAMKAASSALSRESGFHSASATNSVCSSLQVCDIPSSNGSVFNASDYDDDVGSVISQGSVISLMSCQSALSQNFSGGNFIPENTLRRNDYKRHSMSSLRKFHQNSGFSHRNSSSRRSAIIPRYNPKMSAIEEYSRKFFLFN